MSEVISGSEATGGPSTPYWQGAERGELVLQRCRDCGHIRHYPQILCNRCQSFETESIKGSGHGEVHSWTVTHHVFSPEVGADVPYALVTVDLPEGVRMLGRFPQLDLLRPGLPVRLAFQAGPENTPIPVFYPATDSEESTDQPTKARR